MKIHEQHTKNEKGGIFLEAEDRFNFACHPGLLCFTRCCRDVNIFLTPYDILRMKNRIGSSSGAFLKAHTLSLVADRSGFPVVALKMKQEKDKRCPFVRQDGCLVYEDRPWSCRMYPLDRTGDTKTFQVIADRDRCLGLTEKRRWTVKEWITDQGVTIYEHMERPLKALVANPRLSEKSLSNPKIRDMIYMALYDLDRFRRFVFESRFLEVFFLEQEQVKKMERDELELMDFAFTWLRFGLISGDTLRIKEEALRVRKQKA